MFSSHLFLSLPFFEEQSYLTESRLDCVIFLIVLCCRLRRHLHRRRRVSREIIRRASSLRSDARSPRKDRPLQRNHHCAQGSSLSSHVARKLSQLQPEELGRQLCIDRQHTTHDLPASRPRRGAIVATSQLAGVETNVQPPTPL